MASPSNPFDEFDKPLATRHAEGRPANPFDEFDEPPPTPPIATSATGLNPERAAMYEREKGHPLEALKRELSEAAQGAKEFGSAIARPFVKAGEMFLTPLDTAHSVERFINAGEYSPAALRNFLTTGPGPEAPSQQAEQWLNAHTIAPTTTSGRVAEEINAALLGARLPGLPKPPAARPMPNPTQDLIAAAEKHDVPLYYDDVTKSAFAKKLGVGAENVPLVGTSAGRAKQAEAAKKAAEAVQANFGDEIADDIPIVLQKGLQDQLNAFRAQAGARYNLAGVLLDRKGIVPTPRFVRAIRRELYNQRQLGSAANPHVVALLRKYQMAPEGNFTLARQLRSQLKNEISEFYRGGENKAIGEAGVERLRGMRDALEADMGDFANKAGGDAASAWKEADDFYKTNLVPFKERGFAELVKTQEPEKAWQYLMTQGGIESRAERMYNALNDSGRAAVRSGVINDAMANAISPKGFFSPAKFAKYMEDHANVVDQFFKGPDKQEIKGFTNLMRHVERAGQYMENPPTGQRVIGALMVGSAALSLKPLLIGAAAAGGTRVLFQTQRGRDLLLAASKLKPGSPAMNVMGNRIGRLMLSGSMTPYRNQGEEETADAIGQ